MRHPLLSSSRVSVVMVAVGGLLLLGCQKQEREPASKAPAPAASSPSPAATAPAAPTPAAPAAPTPAAPAAPGPSASAAPSAPAASPGPHCSASTLSPEPSAPASPLPAAVESMRRRIVAAAVACDYKALAALAHEKGADFSFGFGDEEDVAAAWRKQEEGGEPVLAPLVKVLSMPYTKLGTLYVWPSAYGAEATDEDWNALKSLYSAEQIADLRSNEDGYMGFRAGIAASGDWQFALSGD